MVAFIIYTEEINGTSRENLLHIVSSH